MKELITTKSFWAGLVTVVTGIGMVVMKDYANGAQTILGGLTAMFLRHAVAKTESGE